MKWKDIKILIVTYVTIEPVIFFFALGRGLGTPTTYNLWYTKVCLNEYPEYVCEELNNNKSLYKEEEEWVQKTASKWRFYENLIYVIPAMIASIVYGAWGDRFSRKVPLIVPVVGTLLEQVGYILNSIFLDGPPALLLPSSFIVGVSGGYLTLLAASFSYLSEVSAEDKRTVRISIAYAMNMLSAAIATFVSGLLLETTGFLFMFSLTSCCFTFALICVVFWLKDFTPQTKAAATAAAAATTTTTTITTTITTTTVACPHVVRENPERQGELANEQNQSTQVTSEPDPQTQREMQQAVDFHSSSETTPQAHQQSTLSVNGSPHIESDGDPTGVCEKCDPEKPKETCCSKFKRLFTLRHMLDAFLLLTKKRPSHQRAHLNILMFMVFYLLACSTMSVTYLYLIDRGLTHAEFGYYSGYTQLAHGFCLLLVIPAMKTRLGLMDTVVVMAGILSTMASNAFLAFSTEKWMFFLVPLLDCFHSGTLTGMRSMLSVIVGQDEQGKMFALVACVECIGSLCASSLYGYLVYPATFDSFPGFSFILEAILLIVILLIAGGLHFDIKRLNSYARLVEENGSNGETGDAVGNPALDQALEQVGEAEKDSDPEQLNSKAFEAVSQQESCRN